MEKDQSYETKRHKRERKKIEEARRVLICGKHIPGKPRDHAVPKEEKFPSYAFPASTLPQLSLSRASISSYSG